MFNTTVICPQQINDLKFCSTYISWNVSSKKFLPCVSMCSFPLVAGCSLFAAAQLRVGCFEEKILMFSRGCKCHLISHFQTAWGSFYNCQSHPNKCFLSTSALQCMLSVLNQSGLISEGCRPSWGEPTVKLLRWRWSRERMQCCGRGMTNTLI